MLKTTKYGIEYRPIGDRFKYSRVILKVEEHISEEVLCAGCYFIKLGICFGIKRVIGACVKETRPDHKDVIFKEVWREVSC